jgi:hypothetical protein
LITLEFFVEKEVRMELLISKNFIIMNKLDDIDKELYDLYCDVKLKKMMDEKLYR